MLFNAEELEKLSIMDPQIQAFIAANPMPPLDWYDVKGVRVLMDTVSKQTLESLGAPEPAIVEEYRDIPMRDGFQNRIKIHKPAVLPATGSPLIVAIFGGGFIAGDMHQSTAAARAYVRLFGATVVAPSYRLAPEYKFPTGQLDAWDAVKWLDENAAEIGADPSQGFIISGVSAGAVCTAAIVAHAIEHPLTHFITGQYLCVPSIMDEDCVPDRFRPYFLSRQHNKVAPILPLETFDALLKHTEWDAKSPWRHAILSPAPLSKQPPAYIQVDGMDTIRDEGLIWEEMLKEAGVKTKLDLYPGCPHAHMAFMQGIEVSNRATADQMVGVGWLLGKTVSPAEGLGALAPRSQ